MKIIHHLHVMMMKTMLMMMMMMARIMAILKIRINEKYAIPIYGRYVMMAIMMMQINDDDMHYLLTVGISNSISSLAGIFTY